MCHTKEHKSSSATENRGCGCEHTGCERKLGRGQTHGMGMHTPKRAPACKSFARVCAKNINMQMQRNLPNAHGQAHMHGCSHKLAHHWLTYIHCLYPNELMRAPTTCRTRACMRMRTHTMSATPSLQSAPTTRQHGLSTHPLGCWHLAFQGWGNTGCDTTMPLCCTGSGVATAAPHLYTENHIFIHTTTAQDIRISHCAGIAKDVGTSHYTRDEPQLLHRTLAPAIAQDTGTSHCSTHKSHCPRQNAQPRPRT